MKTIFSLLVLIVSSAAAQVALTTEHVDLGINFNSAALTQPGGPWRLTVRDEDNQTEYLGQRSGRADPERVVLSAGISGRTNIPDDSRYTFLGPVGANVWVLPQSQDNDLLFLGTSLENKSSDPSWQGDGVEPGFLAQGVASGLFQSNRVTLRLESFAGPGNFFLYFTDSFGDPVVYFNTIDGLSANDSRLFSPSNHVHFNWAFTAPGSYSVGLRASGTLVSGNAFTESEVTTFRFVVVPEPSAVLLLAPFAVFCIARRSSKIAPALLTLAAFHPLAASAYTTITDEHVDLQIEFADRALNGKIRPDSNTGGVARDEALLFDGPPGPTSVARPAGATWDFLGVAAGAPIYYWPQSLTNGRMYLGFGSDHGSIPAGTLASYIESDPRVNVAAPWVKIALTALRYEAAPGESGAPDFSLWQTGSFGPPVVWMSTALGGITATDATWLLEGGHGHFNWGFTKRGYYQLDFKFSGFLAGTGVPIESTTQTYHFGVEFSPPTIPTDIAARGSVIADRAPVDFRINTPGTAGSIALASADTHIHSLLQNTTTPATVETAGKTLHASRIEIASGMAPLTIGALPADGSLASSDLFLAANDPAAALTIHAAIAASTVTKTGPGPLEIHGPQSFGTLHAEAGTTRFYSNATLGALAIGAGAEVTFGSAPPSFAAATAVPEPGSLSLLALSGLAFFSRNKKQQRTKQKNTTKT